MGSCGAELRGDKDRPIPRGRARERDGGGERRAWERKQHPSSANSNKGLVSPALVGGHYYYCVRSGRYTTVAHTEIRGTIWAVCVSAIKRLGSGGREGVGSVRNTKYTQRGTRRTKRAWYSILMGEETLTAAFPLSLPHPSLPCLFSAADARRAGTSVG